MPVRPSLHLTRRGRVVLALAMTAAMAAAWWALSGFDGASSPPVATVPVGPATTAAPSPSPSLTPDPPARIERGEVEAGARWLGDDPAAAMVTAVDGLLDAAPVVVVAEGDALTPARGVAWRLHAPLLPVGAPDLPRLLDRLGTDTVVHVMAAGAGRSEGASSAPTAPDLGSDDREVLAVPVEDGAVDRSVLEDLVPPEPPTGDGPLVLVRPDDPARPLLDTLALAADVSLVPVTADLARDEAVVRRLRASGDAPWAVAGTSSSWADVPERVLAWDLEVVRSGVELPGGGLRMFPGRTLVAMYGSPDAASLGILGEQPVEAAVDRARQLAADYDPLVEHPVVPTFEIITTVASGSAGPAGDYSVRVPHDRVVPWIEAAADAGIYVILDLQPGRTDFLTQAKEVEALLQHPHVGLALDPEWRLLPDQVHLRQIGSVRVEEVQAVADWLAELTREAGLPQKLLLLHQFRLSMLPGIDALRVPPELAVAIQMDGQGSQGAKDATWQAITTISPPDGVWWGWKNFYDEDIGLRSPADTLAVEPTPVLVSYQ